MNRPLPDARHLYLLAVGLALGIVLGPAVLGRVWPPTYDRWFDGAGDAAAALTAFDERTRDDLERLTATGVTDIARDEYLAQREAERFSLPAFQQSAIDRFEHAQAMTDRLLAIVLAVVLIMGLEAWAGPNVRAGQAVVSPMLGRLVTIRYALISLWIMLALAAPAALLRVPWVFVAALIVVALVVGLVPLGKRPSTTEGTETQRHGEETFLPTVEQNGHDHK